MNRDFPAYIPMLPNSVSLPELDAANDEPDPDEEYEIERAEAEARREAQYEDERGRLQDVAEMRAADDLRAEIVRIARAQR